MEDKHLNLSTEFSMTYRCFHESLGLSYCTLLKDEAYGLECSVLMLLFWTRVDFCLARLKMGKLRLAMFLPIHANMTAENFQELDFMSVT